LEDLEEGVKKEEGEEEEEEEEEEGWTTSGLQLRLKVARGVMVTAEGNVRGASTNKNGLQWQSRRGWQAWQSWLGI
jgi:hypothetical protein